MRAVEGKIAASALSLFSSLSMMRPTIQEFFTDDPNAGDRVGWGDCVVFTMAAFSGFIFSLEPSKSQFAS